jgi:hypothetical protein
MQPRFSPNPDFPQGWTHVLEQVQEALAQAVTDAATREQALLAILPGPDGTTPPARLSTAEDWKGLAEPMSEVERRATEVAALFGESEGYLRQWLEAARANRQRLANGAGHGV